MTLEYGNKQDDREEATESEVPIGGDPVISNTGQANLAERVRAERLQRVVRAKANNADENTQQQDDKAKKENPHAGTMLRVGSSGAPVTFLQEALNKTGAELSTDGAFGPATRAAVVAFQRAASIAADGIVGPQTWGKFDADAITVPKTAKQKKTSEKKEKKPDENIEQSKGENKQKKKTPDASSMGAAVIAAGLAHQGAVKAHIPSGETRQINGRNVKLRTGADLLYKIISETSPQHGTEQHKADIMDVNVRIGPEGGQRVPSWCGIFALWIQNQAGNSGGAWPGPWMGPNIGPNKLFFRNPGETPRPGDVCYMQSRSHHGTVMEVNGSSVTTIEGNTGVESTIEVRTKSLGEWLGFARVVAKADEQALDDD